MTLKTIPTNRDQRMMSGVLTVVITADSKEELDSYTETLFTIGSGRLCQFATLKYQQLEGLKTVLPYVCGSRSSFRNPIGCSRQRKYCENVLGFRSGYWIHRSIFFVGQHCFLRI